MGHPKLQSLSRQAQLYFFSKTRSCKQWCPKGLVHKHEGSKVWNLFTSLCNAEERRAPCIWNKHSAAELIYSLWVWNWKHQFWVQVKFWGQSSNFYFSFPRTPSTVVAARLHLRLFLPRACPSSPLVEGFQSPPHSRDLRFHSSSPWDPASYLHTTHFLSLKSTITYITKSKMKIFGSKSHESDSKPQNTRWNESEVSAETA